MLFAYTRYKYRKTAPSAQCQLDDHWGLLLDAGYQLSVEKIGLYHMVQHLYNNWFRNADFDSFAQKHGFTYSAVYFSSFADMTLATPG